MGVGAAPANEPMFRIKPFLLMHEHERSAETYVCQCDVLVSREGEMETNREAMEGAMRLVIRSVAVTLTLMMVANSSGEVSTKSVGNSWDTPTLLTVIVGQRVSQQKSVSSSFL